MRTHGDIEPDSPLTATSCAMVSLHSVESLLIYTTENEKRISLLVPEATRGHLWNGSGCIYTQGQL